MGKFMPSKTQKLHTYKALFGIVLDESRPSYSWSSRLRYKDYQSSLLIWTTWDVKASYFSKERDEKKELSQNLSKHIDILRKLSMHKKPDKTSTYSKTFQELNPGQPIGVDFESPHHQVEDFFMLSDNEWAISSVELLDLLKLYFANFCQLKPSRYNYYTVR